MVPRQRQENLHTYTEETYSAHRNIGRPLIFFFRIYANSEKQMEHVYFKNWIQEERTH